MGIRDTAMSSQSKYLGVAGDLKSIKRQNVPNIYPQGVMTIEIAIPLVDIGSHSDPEDPNYDYFKAMSEAEDIAMSRIEALAGKDVKQRYRIEMSAQDEYDEIIVTAVLIPRKNK